MTVGGSSDSAQPLGQPLRRPGRPTAHSSNALRTIDQMEAAQRTNREHCFVIDPRCTVVSDSR